MITPFGLPTRRDLVSRVGGYYQSDAENYINNDSVQNENLRGFWLWNASASLLMDDWAWCCMANLGNEAGVTGAFPSAYWSYDTGVFESWYGSSNRQMITQPRTVGLSLTTPSRRHPHPARSDKQNRPYRPVFRLQTVPVLLSHNTTSNP